MKKRRRSTALFCRFFETEILRAKLEGNVQWLLSAGNKYCKGGIKLGGIRRVKGGAKNGVKGADKENIRNKTTRCANITIYFGYYLCALSLSKHLAAA